MKQNSKTAFYFAIDREEKSPSLCVDFAQNKAFDFGTGKSYDVISIVQQLSKCSVSDALQYLEKFNTSIQSTQTSILETSKNYEILEVKEIEHLALAEYLKSRKIHDQKHLVKEVHYQMKGKNYFGIGFYNNSGGVEIRNKYSKICLGKKDVTLLKNPKKEKNEVCVFEGFFDFLTYLNLPNVQFSNSDFLILNSTAMFFKVEKQLAQYDKIVLFLDNDLSGSILTEKIVDKYENVEDCSILYEDFKDLNEWGCANRIID
ncbi:toprim domain-containing protein [Kaistella palustris]|uniref:toprim domain-containing protein n=1 Tax=Kaistella palustris TaxID=493376 RepID=UPI0029342A90|nr:toprim domain-containing protein [Kaistella palustris]